MKKIIESFNSLNDQARYAVLAGVVVAVILLDVIFLVLPQIGGIADVNDQIKKLSDDTQQVMIDKQRINLLRKILKKEHLKLNSLSAKVRPILEVPSILSTISSIANEYGVKIDQLVPEKKEQESLKAAGEDKYYALPVIIKAHCGYHMFGRFLNKLENQDLYFTMQDFIIQNDANDPHSELFSLTIKIILVDREAGN